MTTFKARDKSGADTTFVFENPLSGELTIVRDGNKIIIDADHVLQFVIECWLKPAVGAASAVQELKAAIDAMKAPKEPVKVQTDGNADSPSRAEDKPEDP